MKVIRHSQIPKEEAHSSLFFGGAVTRQGLVEGDASRYFTLSIVNFSAGARNKFHTHTTDQLLFVTEGEGIVATQEEEHVVTEGTTIHISAGEKHWHGATPGSAFSHIALTGVGSKTEVAE